MEKTSLGYSDKNIPVPSENSYRRKLIISAEKFIRRARWRAFFALGRSQNSNPRKETYGFPTSNPAPQVPELKELEDEILNLVKNISFSNYSKPFLRQLAKDVKSLGKEQRMLVCADKTTNLYKITHRDYNKLLDEAITKNYKKAHPASEKKITRDEKKIATKLDIDDRVEKTAERDAFIAVKDHKENFENNPKTRLLNPTKPELGKVSKVVLERLNNSIKNKSKLKLWRNTSEVIQWFKSIENKKQHAFLGFDVVEFYPSITENLLREGLEWAKTFEDISEDEFNTILQVKHSLLYHANKAWVKKGDQFDVTMGSYDGAETCELIGLFLLSKIESMNIGLNAGLYRDDGLIVSDQTPRGIEQIKQKLSKIFKDCNLSIEIEANKKIINFLDVTLNLNDGSFSPYTKPNNNPLYVNANSNHPPSILKNIPLGINKRLSSISSSQEIFDRNITPYQDALHSAGYKYKLKFDPQAQDPPKQKRTRKRKILYFNPPFSANVQTDIGRKFLNIVDKCIPPGHPLRKSFNKNTIKISYSCMPSMGAVVSGHNKKILENAKLEPPTNRNINLLSFYCQ